MNDNKVTFELTENHIKLIRSFYIGWQNCETGAPEVDPKRPYGNSSVAYDVYEIINGYSPADELDDDTINQYLTLHRETETALQIVLRTGKFQPGVYQHELYTRDWELVS